LQKEEELSPTEQSSTEEESHHDAIDAIPGTSAVMQSVSEESFISPAHELSVLNESLRVLGESPIIHRKLRKTPLYAKTKARKIESAVKKRIELCTGTLLSDEMPVQSPDMEIINQLKKKFRSCTKNSEKIQILTVLPNSWTLKRVVEEFQVSEYMARKAKNLVKEKGILSTPNPKVGAALPTKTVDLVKGFYFSEEISRLMPGKKDYVSVKVNGERQHAQKRLIMSNLKETFQAFKEIHPDLKIGFSKFAALRPKECILAGESGTHSVCVCTTHAQQDGCTHYQKKKLLLQHKH
jgi:hypothetical protein